ncbi:MAG: cytochrome bc complex cytochrome b subunit [Candidatus Velthaea sp.]
MVAPDMITRHVKDFLDERFGTNAGLRYLLAKVYPDHWSFYLGEFALYTFILLVATGVWLTFVYSASAEGAYISVLALSRAAPVGYLIRQVHHWSAVTFVAAILIHMARIFFTGAFRKPRELNWVIGVLMLILASLTGFTGYSLPNDQLSGTGLRISDSVLLALPFIGGWAADVFNGGGYPGPLLLPHLYTIHVYFLPVAIAALLSLHLGMLIYQKHTQFVADEKHVVGRRFWPDYALRTLAAFGATVAVIMLLASTVEINPVADYGPYKDWMVPNPATPDWYAAFLDGGLRLGPAVEWQIFGHPIPALFWPGVILPLVVVTFVLAYPWIDKLLTGDREYHDVLVPPNGAPLRVGIGTALITAGIILTLVAGDDQQAEAFHISVTTLVTLYRVLLPVLSISAGVLAAIIARELNARYATSGHEPERVVVLRRNASGGFDEEEPQSI